MNVESTHHQLGRIVSQRIHPKDIPQEAWPEIMNAAVQHSLAPMLLWTTKQFAPDLVTEPSWTPIISFTRSAAIRYVKQEFRRKQVSTVLEAAHIPALWLKGAVLAQTVYPQPTLRPMSDLDVLVPYDQREEALSTVATLGYTRKKGSPSIFAGDKELRENLEYEYVLEQPGDVQVLLELHFSLLKNIVSHEQLAWFWSQTQRLPDGTMTLNNEAHLLYLCAHAILHHGEAEFYLLRFFDLYRLINQEPLNWDLVVEQAKVFKWTFAVERALKIAVDYFDPPIPEHVFLALSAARPSDEDTNRVLRLQGRWSESGKTLSQFYTLPVSARLRFIYTMIFPPRSYIAHRYHIHTAALLWWGYLRNGLYLASTTLRWLKGILIARYGEHSR